MNNSLNDLKVDLGWHAGIFKNKYNMCTYNLLIFFTYFFKLRYFSKLILEQKILNILGTETKLKPLFYLMKNQNL